MGDDINQTGTGTAFPSDQRFHDYLLSTSMSSGTRFYIDGSLAFSSALYAGVGVGGSQTRLARQVTPFQEYFTGEMDFVQIFDGVTNPASLAAVPLPAGVLLLASGSLFFAGASWRRRRIGLREK